MPREWAGTFDIFEGEFRMQELGPRRGYTPSREVMLGADTALGSLPHGAARSLGAGRGGIGRSTLRAGGSGRRQR